MSDFKFKAVTNVTDDQFLRERIAEMLEQRETLAPALEAFAEEMPASRRRRELRRLAGRLRNGATVDEFCQEKNMTTTWLPLLGGAVVFAYALCVFGPYIRLLQDLSV